MDSMLELIHRTAVHLAGRRVIVRLQPPIIQDCYASAQKRADGVPVVDIHPQSSDDYFMHAFCHELAHVRLHMREIVPSNVQRLPQSVKEAARTVQAQRAVDRREAEAGALADKWKDYAERHYREYKPYGYSKLVCQLMALANM